MTVIKAEIPTADQEWRELAARMIRAHMSLAGINQKQLMTRLARLGVNQTTSNISAKLRHGTFGATFFLQALVACGVEHFTLPSTKELP